MRANELMIGDLVVYKDRVIRVENVHHDRINYYPDIPYIQEEDYIEEKDIVPIPLTPEILEKNGWDKITYPYKGLYEHSDTSFYVRIVSCDTYFYDYTCNDDGYCIFDCVYVHELQHALRLCGLTDLADNFIIE